MISASACLKSMRLRTLPLSLSGVIVGISLARVEYTADVMTVVFLLLTTCCLQILSNLSNELGDTLHGTDTRERQGMHYAVQDGEMTVGQLGKLVIAAAISCVVSGLLLIRFSFGGWLGTEQFVFMALGGAAVAAAMRYTLGRNPYGYRGLGDLFVLIFFGLVSTLGAFYISSRSLDFRVALLPAFAVGLFSIGVLNVNNIRDMKTDVLTRTTVALKLGGKRARIYQTLLIVSGWGLMLCHTFIFSTEAVDWLCFLTMPLFGMHLKGVWSREGRALDPMLPLLVMSTFLMSVMFAVSAFK